MPVEYHDHDHSFLFFREIPSPFVLCAGTRYLWVCFVGRLFLCFGGPFMIGPLPRAVHAA